MLKDPLVLSLITNIVKDESNLAIVKCLIKGVKTDEEIAEKTEIRLNTVRKILYNLYNEGIASYKRSKDPETQWYTYEWEFEKEEVLKNMDKSFEEQISSLKKKLDEEKNDMFFTCNDCNLRFDFESSSDLGFICPECGEEMEFEDNTEIVNKIKEDIAICEKNYKSFKKINDK